MRGFPEAGARYAENGFLRSFCGRITILSIKSLRESARIVRMSFLGNLPHVKRMVSVGIGAYQTQTSERLDAHRAALFVNPAWRLLRIRALVNGAVSRAIKNFGTKELSTMGVKVKMQKPYNIKSAPCESCTRTPKSNMGCSSKNGLVGCGRYQAWVREVWPIVTGRNRRADND